MKAQIKQVVIIYDGDCPICHRLITVTRLKNADITLKLINARDCNVYDITWFPPDVSIHSDMVVKIGQQIFYGADGLHALSLMASKSTGVNKIIYAVFSIKPLAKVMYPLMRWSRMLLLKLLRIKPLD